MKRDAVRMHREKKTSFLHFQNQQAFHTIRPQRQVMWCDVNARPVCFRCDLQCNRPQQQSYTKRTAFLNAQRLIHSHPAHMLHHSPLQLQRRFVSYGTHQQLQDRQLPVYHSTD
jgi:hypothetical protein